MSAPVSSLVARMCGFVGEEWLQKWDNVKREWMIDGMRGVGEPKDLIPYCITKLK